MVSKRNVMISSLLLTNKIAFVKMQEGEVGINNNNMEDTHMLSLSFAEQIKIILGRQKMTIKELAEKVEETTGKKMSRQNLTQRLNRDNFQEQDMRMIAEILGCKFQLNIIDSADEEKSIEPTPQELQKVTKKREQKATVVEKHENELTLGEVAAMLGDEPILQDIEQEEAARELSSTQEIQSLTDADIDIQETVKKEESTHAQAKAAYAKEQFAHKPVTEAVQEPEIEKEPIKSRIDEEDLELGELNPYTGREYETNSVRVHPKRIGYVQVYDRSEHKWTDMTEWAFLGYQERKKVLLGKDYEQPIYLD